MSVPFKERLLMFSKAADTKLINLSKEPPQKPAEKYAPSQFNEYLRGYILIILIYITLSFLDCDVTIYIAAIFAFLNLSDLYVLYVPRQSS